jgi:hypothetical protein
MALVYSGINNDVELQGTLDAENNINEGARQSQ